MRLAADLAGFTLGQADTLRKAMGKKDRELMAQQREQFIKGCKANKVEGRKAERIWDLIEKFAGYGFNKCLTADTWIELAGGVRPVGRLTLANGMSVRCTPDHPIFTQRGWVNAEELAAGDHVAVARSLPAGPEAVPAHKAALLGYALSEGSLGYDSHLYLYSNSSEELEGMARSVSTFPNTIARLERRKDGRAGSVRPARLDRGVPSDAVSFLFGECGLQNKGTLEKRVPLLVDRWDGEALAILVAALFQGDG